MWRERPSWAKPRPCTCGPVPSNSQAAAGGALGLSVAFIELGPQAKGQKKRGQSHSHCKCSVTKLLQLDWEPQPTRCNMLYYSMGIFTHTGDNAVTGQTSQDPPRHALTLWAHGTCHPVSGAPPTWVGVSAWFMTHLLALTPDLKASFVPYPRENYPWWTQHIFCQR